MRGANAVGAVRTVFQIISIARSVTTMCPVMTGGQRATKKAAPVVERFLEFWPPTDSRSEIIIDDSPGHFRCTSTELLAVNREHADTDAVVSVWGQCKSRDPVIFEHVL